MAPHAPPAGDSSRSSSGWGVSLGVLHTTAWLLYCSCRRKGWSSSVDDWTPYILMPVCQAGLAASQEAVSDCTCRPPPPPLPLLTLSNKAGRNMPCGS
jgi:hypothetical protein